MQAAIDITFPYLHAREAFEEKIGKFQVSFSHKFISGLELESFHFVYVSIVNAS